MDQPTNTAAVHCDENWAQLLRGRLDSMAPAATLEYALQLLSHFPDIDMNALLDTARSIQRAWRASGRMAALGLPDSFLPFAVAIYLYTLETIGLLPGSVYKVVNGSMRVRERNGPGGIGADLENCLPYIKFLDEALRRLPDQFIVRGKVRRGVKWVYPSPAITGDLRHDPDSYFRPGNELYWYEFKSTSTNPEVMTRPHFCGVEPGPRTIFTVTATCGYDIKDFSAIPEAEVLFRPLVRLRVVGAARNVIDGRKPEDGGPTTLAESGHPDQVILQQIEEAGASRDTGAPSPPPPAPPPPPPKEGLHVTILAILMALFAVGAAAYGMKTIQKQEATIQVMMQQQQELIAAMLKDKQAELQSTNMLQTVEALAGQQAKAAEGATTTEEMEKVQKVTAVVVKLAEGDQRGANAAIKEAGAAMEETAAALYTKGAALKSEEKWAEAVNVLKKAVAKDATLKSAWFDLGYCLDFFGLKDYKGAEAAYRKAIEADPKYAAAHYNLGRLLDDVRKDYDGAEAAYRKAIEADPKNLFAHNNLGVLLKNVHKDYKGAEAAYRKAIEADPNNAAAHTNLGVLLEHVRKDYKRAEAAYRKAIEADPNNAGAHTNLGLLLQNVRKDYKRAEAAYRKAIEADPKYAISYWNLGDLLEKRRGDIGGAIKAIEGYILAGNPDNDGEQRLKKLRKKLGA